MTVALDRENTLNQVACPRCAGRFKIPPDEEEIMTVTAADSSPQDAPLDVLPAETIPYVSAAEPVLSRQSARPAPTDRHEEFDGQVVNAAAAERLLAAWKKELPEVPSAYQPSGALPVSALLSMGLGAVFGAAAGGTVVFFGGVVVAAIGALTVLGIACAGLLSIAIVVLGLLLCLVTFAFAGWVSASCTTRAGRSGKNRNIRAAIIFSVVSAVLSAVVAWTLSESIRTLPILAGKDFFGPQVGGFYVIPLIFVLIGGLVAAIVAGIISADQVRSAKFCEDCERYMQGEELKKVTLGGLQVLARALNTKDLGPAASLLQTTPGENGTLRLFSCSSCSRGYLEVTADFKARWKEKKANKDKSESWLVGSLQLTDAELARFHPNR
jgi:hypothetical protein